jgi:hypothetical protein
MTYGFFIRHRKRVLHASQPISNRKTAKPQKNSNTLALRVTTPRSHCSQRGSFINQKQVKEMDLTDDDDDDAIAIASATADVATMTAEANCFLQSCQP